MSAHKYGKGARQPLELDYSPILEEDERKPRIQQICWIPPLFWSIHRHEKIGIIKRN